MTKEIKIGKKRMYRGDDGHKTISVRMKDEQLEQLEDLAAKTDRSRNEVINLLLESAIDMIKIEE